MTFVVTIYIYKGGANNEIRLFDSLPVEANQYCVISGGQGHNLFGNEYRTTGSVITGGKDNCFGPILESSVHPNNHMTISGCESNYVRGRQSVVTGGYTNYSRGRQSVARGGEENIAFGEYSAIPGGILNKAVGTASIAMGQQARVLHDHSMVINLQGTAQPVESTAPGQFLVQAKVYKFQVTNDPGPGERKCLLPECRQYRTLTGCDDGISQSAFSK